MLKESPERFNRKIQHLKEKIVNVVLRFDTILKEDFIVFLKELLGNKVKKR